MGASRGTLALVVSAGCTSVFGLETPAHRSDAGGALDAAQMIDGPIDAPFPTGSFSTPVRIAELSVTGPSDDDPSLTGDMLEIFFESNRTGASQIYTSTRATTSSAWSNPTMVNELSSPDGDTSIEVSYDGLTMYFGSDRAGAAGIDIYKSTRTARDQPWTTPIRVVELSSSAGDHPCNFVAVELRMYMYSARGASTDIYVTTRASTSAAWSTPALVSGLTSNGYDGECFVDVTGAMWYTHDAAPGLAIWRAIPDGSGGFTNNERVVELDSTSPDNDAWLSPDGHTIVFTSTRAGDLDIYFATR